MIAVERYHDFSYGHRIMDEGECSQLHGHNARVHFKVTGFERNRFGQVVDFKLIKNTLCQWVEDHWNSKMLLKGNDEFLLLLNDHWRKKLGIVVLDEHPSAENLAEILLKEVGPSILPSKYRLVEVRFKETRKCSIVINYEL